MHADTFCCCWVGLSAPGAWRAAARETAARRRGAGLLHTFQEVKTAAIPTIHTKKSLGSGRVCCCCCCQGATTMHVLGSTPGGIGTRHRHEGGVHAPGPWRLSSGCQCRCRIAVHARPDAVNSTAQRCGPAEGQRPVQRAADRPSVSRRTAGGSKGCGRWHCACRMAMVSGCGGREGWHRRHWSNKPADTALQE